MTTTAALCRHSERTRVDPFAALEWPAALDPDAWLMSPELLSLFGTETYAGLTAAQRKRLGLYEAVNFFSLNIHGERLLIEGLARRLYRSGSEELSAYLHHFLEEENGHMVQFGRFCQRYAGKVYSDRKIAAPGRPMAEGEDDFLFFARALVFEEIADAHNRHMAVDPRLAPIARQINRYHHAEEVRHLAFGRRIVRELFERSAPAWSHATLAGVRRRLVAFLEATWREYYNPDVYRDLGLAEPFALARAAFDHPGSRLRRRTMSERCLRFLGRSGILLAEPEA